MENRQNTGDVPKKRDPRDNLRRGGGRPKGVPNKTTTLAKDAIAKAAEKLGGTDRLVAWAKEDDQNERLFWGSIYPKLLPLQVSGEGGGPILHMIERRIVKVAG